MKRQVVCTRQVVLGIYSACRHVRWALVCSLVFLSVALITSFAPSPFGLLRSSKAVATGDSAPDGCRGIRYCVCPRETICADSVPRMIFLGLARGSAYLDYPFYILLFLGKARNLQSYLQTTVVAMYVDISDHRLHTIGGAIVGFEVFWHSFWHLLRWSSRGDDIRFLWETSTGRTGLLSLCLTPLIVWPALFPFLKKRMSYEVRKGLHYLATVWGVSICFHAPATHILKLIGIPIVIYVVDYIYGLFAKTHLVRSTQFRRLETCSEMSFINPPGFKLDGPGWVFLCLPWISKYQWHAFSAFPHFDQPNKTSLWMAAAGDWTRLLHTTISKPTCRPAWIAGPFNSPCGRAIEVDNILAVASGIGITPALALVRMHANTRSVNLIWMCRDPSLVEFYLDNVDFDNDAWTLIYYTGKRDLCIKELPMNVVVFKKRPDLERVLTAVVQDIEEGVGLDEDTNDMISMTSEEQRFRIAVKKVLSTYTRQEIFDSAAYASLWEPPTSKTPKAGGAPQPPDTSEPVIPFRPSVRSSYGGGLSADTTQFRRLTSDTPSDSNTEQQKRISDKEGVVTSDISTLRGVLPPNMEQLERIASNEVVLSSDTSMPRGALPLPPNMEPPKRIASNEVVVSSDIATLRGRLSSDTPTERLRKISSNETVVSSDIATLRGRLPSDTPTEQLRKVSSNEMVVSSDIATLGGFVSTDTAQFKTFSKEAAVSSDTSQFKGRRLKRQSTAAGLTNASAARGIGRASVARGVGRASVCAGRASVCAGRASVCGPGVPKKAVTASAQGVCRAIIEMCGDGAPSEEYLLGLLQIPEENAAAMMMYSDYDDAMDNVDDVVDNPRDSKLARNLTNHAKISKGTERNAHSDVSNDLFTTVMCDANSKKEGSENQTWQGEDAYGNAWSEDDTSPLAAGPATDKWRDDIRANWEVMYCGGAQRVVDELSKVTSKVGLRFSIEKFDW